jgi:hypothetical protein
LARVATVPMGFVPYFGCADANASDQPATKERPIPVSGVERGEEDFQSFAQLRETAHGAGLRRMDFRLLRGPALPMRYSSLEPVFQPERIRPPTVISMG